MESFRKLIFATFALLAMCSALDTLFSRPARAAAEARGNILFLRCASCHDISNAASAKIGPNLAGVFERQVASLPNYSYSAALRALDFKWDAVHLDEWLTNPNAVASGTTMAFAGLPDSTDRASLIAYLRQLQTQAP